ncbi:hypothetical protein KY290_021848 [Solanum tuberosum]|uniref:Uncharacterized protein n=1 Tax=Solanum tuberosum TaxID=4113 RepID=A0ABQ7V2Q3_SOLTU|nr:hypothetical protein KY290_021848 [Solanum tuberosum]
MADFKPFGSLRSVIDGVKGRFLGTLSGFGSVAVLRCEVDTMATKYLNLRCPIRNDYSSIDWTDTEEEVEPSIQEEVEPRAQENADEDIDNDFICSDQSIDYESDVHEELMIVKEDVRKFRESRRVKLDLMKGMKILIKAKKKSRIS